jgi:hypothetical protein
VYQLQEFSPFESTSNLESKVIDEKIRLKEIIKNQNKRLKLDGRVKSGEFGPQEDRDWSSGEMSLEFSETREINVI